jgi:outer membrane protein OmpA-like peptidoglycan-associated protein
MRVPRPDRSRLAVLAGAAMLCGATFGSAHAQGAVVSQSGTAATVDCGGGDATVQGSGDAVTFRDACRSLMVNGSGNSVRVELQAGGKLTLNGNGNTISYTPIGGSQEAALTDSGQGNTVTRAVADASGATTIVGGTAAPGGLFVRGTHGETVQIGPGGIIANPAPGSGAGAVISPGAIIANAGNGAATGMQPVTGTAPGQILLSGDGLNKDMPCNRANVVISGDNGRFTLRGGCAQVFVRGNNDVVHVELTPSTQLGIAGENSIVYVMVAPGGADPALVVTGANNRVIRVRQLDDTSGTEIPAGRSTGALPSPAGVVVGSAGGAGAVVIPTAQAALAFARGQNLTTLQHDLGAVRTEEGTAVNLSGDVLFDFDRTRLRPDALRSLAELSVLINRTQPRQLRIVGYTDSIGLPQYNLDLSARRARNVEQWLRSDGQIRVASLDVQGRGAARPVAPNTLPDGQDNPSGREQNRRVEVLLQQ